MTNPHITVKRGRPPIEKLFQTQRRKGNKEREIKKEEDERTTEQETIPHRASTPPRSAASLT
jgi:hypothetical protein